MPEGDVEIIVAGLPRTASTSLKKALDILGVGPSFHLGDPPAPIARIRESARTLQIKDRSARQVALWKLYHGFQATFEMPGSMCMDDMLEIWPDAKVILTERRNPQVWLSSYTGLGMSVQSPLFRILGYWIPGVVHSSDLIRAWGKVYGERFGLPPDQIPSAQLYIRHRQWVQELVPPKQLLVFQPEMGWEPLCRFLGRPMPEEGVKFPRVNEAAFLRRVIRLSMVLGACVWVLGFGVLGWIGMTIWKGANGR